MLDFIHAEFAQLPKDLGCTQLRFEELRKIHLHVEVVGHGTFHLRDPVEDLADCGIVDLLRLHYFYSRHYFPPPELSAEKFCYAATPAICLIILSASPGSNHHGE